ncbi:MAG: NifU family protein [Saprospiraceae bacterium]|jgi:Fe-S cluster biogenesis protein NfuA|nr:NifU family protein [Saprospiraceae bacterium]MBK6814865.1 NifU family protein [Saprospiraceae bacterium]MBK7371902.1 NifU family protein [Saprospiraceae bacterium]MBK7435630.1 NifU family protein [Saprospiraceae bacterium]MBK8511232.1 NifU family protein [Saprospiraceae bacterium]
METLAKSPVMLYTEQTPNPETLKFVLNRILYKGIADFKQADQAFDWSPFASALFEFPFVKGVYMCNNFVTITKESAVEWNDIMLELKEYIKSWIADDKPIIAEGYQAYMDQQEKDNSTIQYSEADAELVKRIKELIETYVKPAVEMDGGNIEFKAFDQGTVYVIMQGSCSGCPSSTVTLKAGIEGMLKRMIPEVKEVVSEMG